MTQKVFAEKATQALREDQFVIGLAVPGSWLTNELDEFSDLDLLLVTADKIAGDKNVSLRPPFGRTPLRFYGRTRWRTSATNLPV